MSPHRRRLRLKGSGLNYLVRREDSESAMNIVCIGGGPAGLYFALLMKQQDPAHDDHAWSSATGPTTPSAGASCSPTRRSATCSAADPPTRGADPRRLQPLGRHRGQHPRPQDRARAATASAASAASACSTSCRQRCEELGVELVFETDVQGDDAVSRRRPRHRQRRPEQPHPQRSTPRPTSPTSTCASCRFVWLGTHKLFEAFTFAFEETEHGWFQAHAYRFDDETSTFIVETPEEVWRDGRPGHDGEGGGDRLLREAVRQVPRRPPADVQRQRTCAARRSGSASRAWSARRWVHHNGRAPVVLMGDAAHTAHFSIGSGTKLALEDAIELARCIGKQPRRPGRARCATTRRCAASRC